LPVVGPHEKKNTLWLKIMKLLPMN
jgi:hypothetical protein